MGGGLFGTSLYLNVKCLVFSGAVIAVYFLPHPPTVAHNIVMAFLLGMAAYIALAWYDVLYDCNEQLKPTLLGWLSAPFKPVHYEQEYQRLPQKTQKVIRWVDIAVLSLVVLAFAYPFLYFRLAPLKRRVK
jgi:UDP-N-acetylmuramyl pentapeptide phosphotransferase/UDP-N-acetylglucosamine-1-phosphate transferase